MVFKLSQKNFELIDAVLDDYAKKGKTDKICPYCGTPIKKKVVGKVEKKYEFSEKKNKIVRVGVAPTISPS